MGGEQSRQSNTFNVMMLGDSGVGKTAIIRRFVDEAFNFNMMETIGIEFQRKVLEMEDGSTADLQIWDTAGQERYRAIGRAYYRQADAIVLVFDLSRSETFLQIPSWIKELRDHQAKEDTALILVGNKSDYIDHQVTRNEGEDMALAYGIKYFETSAFNGQNIEETFYDLAQYLHANNAQKGKKGGKEAKNSIKLNTNSNAKKSRRKRC